MRGRDCETQPPYNLPMGEGVSPSLPRNGSPVGHRLEISDPFARELGLSEVVSLISVSLSREHVYCVIFVPFPREHTYYGGSILPVFRSEIGEGSSVPGTREHGSDPFPKGHVFFVESKMLGLVAFRTYMVFAVLARASSKPRRYF